MQQKITTFIFFIIGIGIFCIQCKKKNTELSIKTATYVYKNNLVEPVEFSVFNGNLISTFKIMPLDSQIFIQKGETPFPFNGEFEGNYTGDSVRIKFNSDSCVTYRRDFTASTFSGNGVFNIADYDNYTTTTLSQSSYTLRYSIDSTDFLKSRKCK